MMATGEPIRIPSEDQEAVIEFLKILKVAPGCSRWCVELSPIGLPGRVARS
jgi:hypothetical protein